MLEAIAAIVAAIAGVVQVAMGNAAKNIAGFRNLEQQGIGYNQSKDLATYQLAQQQEKTTSAVIIGGFLLVVAVVVIMMIKKKK